MLLTLPAPVKAQSQPFVVHDTKPVITHGPYLVDPSETSITVVWSTDTPSHALVRYGEGTSLDREGESRTHGLLDVGTRHAVRLSGLSPGRAYRYQVVATRVVKLNAYWPEKGLAIEGPVRSFRTFDRAQASTTFSVITDTHEDVARINALMKRIDWKTSEFLAQTGDAFHWLDNEDQLFGKWLDPVTKALAGERPLLFARGNHEWRGPFARSLFDYLPTTEGRYYIARDVGPVHLLVLDSGEDKPDDTNVYSLLNRSEPYLAEQLRWLGTHRSSEPRMSSAPFRVVLMHQPLWGSMPDGQARWIEAANAAGVDLVIAGHTHRFSRIDPGSPGFEQARFTTVVLGQDQVG
ncbi:MAG: FN3 domain-containing metallophosphoesterase family protein, partial [Vicinamibacterales bacterium]